MTWNLDTVILSIKLTMNDASGFLLNMPYLWKYTSCISQPYKPTKKSDDTSNLDTP